MKKRKITEESIPVPALAAHILKLKNLFLITLQIEYFLMFIYFWKREGEREKTQAGEGKKERGTEPVTGLKFMNREIMTWAKVAHSANWATQVPPFG